MLQKSTAQLCTDLFDVISISYLETKQVAWLHTENFYSCIGYNFRIQICKNVFGFPCHVNRKSEVEYLQSDGMEGVRMNTWWNEIANETPALSSYWA